MKKLRNICIIAAAALACAAGMAGIQWHGYAPAEAVSSSADGQDGAAGPGDLLPPLYLGAGSTACAADGAGETGGGVSEAAGPDESVPAAGYTYQDLDEVRYASCSLHVRSGPSVDYEVLGTYGPGDEVTVTGLCNETGWYRVLYNGVAGYVNGKYTAEEKPGGTAETAATGEAGGVIATTGFTSDAASGAYVGRLYIDSLGVSVALYNSASQSVCNAADSACWIPWGVETMVADHVNQGFSAIKSAVPGETILYIESGGIRYRYICTRVDSRGNNYAAYMATSDGEDVSTINSGGIALYTCNPDVSGTSVTIVFFQPY